MIFYWSANERTSPPSQSTHRCRLHRTYSGISLLLSTIKNSCFILGLSTFFFTYRLTRKHNYKFSQKFKNGRCCSSVFCSDVGFLKCSSLLTIFQKPQICLTQVFKSHTSIQVSLKRSSLTHVLKSHPSVQISPKRSSLTQAFKSHSSVQVSLKHSSLTQAFKSQSSVQVSLKP